ncbi:hypothetical protein BC629DRAFT_1105389 [Irpex lacteus]|nr:hypothetical protein BC629DRAFT_1105389 [Irpex lacteus]
MRQQAGQGEFCLHSSFFVFVAMVVVLFCSWSSLAFVWRLQSLDCYDTLVLYWRSSEFLLWVLWRSAFMASIGTVIQLVHRPLVRMLRLLTIISEQVFSTSSYSQTSTMQQQRVIPLRQGRTQYYAYLPADSDIV